MQASKQDTQSSLPLKLLLIANSSPMPAEGLNTDILSSHDHGVIPYTVSTCLTYYDRKAQLQLFPFPPEIVAQQLSSINQSTAIDAIKIGALCSKLITKTIFNALSHDFDAPIVLDPVLYANHLPLTEEKAHTFYFLKLMPLAKVITPNIIEAELLSGEKITQLSDMYKTAEKLFRMGSKGVLIKGGHLSGSSCIDVLFEGKNFYTYESPRWKDCFMEGLGSMLSTAIAINLAKKLPINEAVLKAREYLGSVYKKRTLEA
jgi:hydroxymethylpyrimidine/phosphomethylpyrimidine kinase